MPCIIRAESLLGVQKGLRLVLDENATNSMVELYILGQTDLRKGEEQVDSFLTGQKRLGVFAYLLLARPRGFRRRDTLLALFWPELAQKAARNALSNMLYQIRKDLGDGILMSRGTEEIGVSSPRIFCDAVEFDACLDRDDVEGALALYRGALLEGFHVPGAAPEFSQWLDTERTRLRERAADAAWKLVERAEASGDVATVRAWARKAAAWSPFSDEAQRRLMEVLHRTGDRTGALQSYEEYAARLRDEWDMPPSTSVTALAHEIRSAPAVEGTSGTAAVSSASSSLAILPFLSIGAGEPTAFTEGIHGDLVTRLSSVAALRVISRTSMRCYRKSEKSARQIGTELGTNWIVEGEVQESETDVRVSARLVDSRADRQVWTNTYHHALTAATLFRIQTDVAREIAGALQAELSPEERKRIGERPTDDLGAYRLYAQGRAHLDQRTKPGMQRALELFRRALKLDSAYVLAWVGVADALALLHDYGYVEAAETLPEAEKAVRKALSLDADSPEGHASLGLLHSVRFEGPPAVRELRHAVELRPSYAEAHNWLSWVHLLLGNRAEALQHSSEAVELNPLSPEAVSNLSLSYLVNGQRQKALAEARREQELGSTWGTGRFYEALALYEIGRFSEAAAALDGVSAAWAGEGPLATRALALAAAGERAEAEKILHRLDTTGDRFAAGLVRAALGSTEEAFDAFSQAEPLSHWPSLAIRHLYQDVWSRLHGDPRYDVLRRRVDATWGVAGPSISTARLNPTGVAVLPFQELGGGEEHAFFASGLYDDLLTKLSRVGTLTVIARASVEPLFEKRTPIPEVARALGIGTVVEGMVRLSGSRVRLNVQLIDAASEALQWAETYDREITAGNIFDLQNELAEKIAAHLEAEVTLAERRRVIQRPTANLDAFRRHAQARHNLDLRSESGMRAALGQLRRALDEDPTYALAWAGMAEALALLEFYGFDAPDDVPDARDAAARAVSLNPDLGEAHAALGIVDAVRHDGPAAVRELERATALAPGYAEAHIWLGWVLVCLGRPVDAIEPAARALQLNPLAPAVHVYTAEICLANGDDAQALRHARRARDIQPTYALAHFIEGVVLHQRRQYDDAAAALVQALPHAHRAPTTDEVRALLGMTLRAGADENGAQEQFDEIDAANNPFPAGLVAAAQGEIDAAFEHLGRAVRDGTAWPEFIRYFLPAELASLRRDRRFDECLRELGRRWGENYSTD